LPDTLIEELHTHLCSSNFYTIVPAIRDNLLRSGVACQKIWGRPKCLTLGEQQYFCLGRRFLKHKMTRYAKKLGRHDPLGPLATPMLLRQSYLLRRTNLTQRIVHSAVFMTES